MGGLSAPSLLVFSHALLQVRKNREPILCGGLSVPNLLDFHMTCFRYAKIGNLFCGWVFRFPVFWICSHDLFQIRKKGDQICGESFGSQFTGFSRDFLQIRKNRKPILWVVCRFPVYLNFHMTCFRYTKIGNQFRGGYSGSQFTGISI